MVWQFLKPHGPGFFWDVPAVPVVFTQYFTSIIGEKGDVGASIGGL